LAHANEHRDWRIYADFVQVLIAAARDLYRDESFGVELSETVYALDSTTIDLCLSLFPRGKFRRRNCTTTSPAAAVLLVGNMFRGPPLPGISQRYYVDSGAHAGPSS
jgi:hypothetical protein